MLPRILAKGRKKNRSALTYGRPHTFNYGSGSVFKSAKAFIRGMGDDRVPLLNAKSFERQPYTKCS
jgi:hypothetical protein